MNDTTSVACEDGSHQVHGKAEKLFTYTISDQSTPDEAGVHDFLFRETTTGLTTAVEVFVTRFATSNHT